MAHWLILFCETCTSILIFQCLFTFELRASMGQHGWTEQKDPLLCGAAHQNNHTITEP